MKRILYLGLLLTLVIPSLAQEEDLERINPKARERIQAARIGYISNELRLTPEEAEKFWPVYRELSEKRIKLMKEYRERKDNPDPKKTIEENDRELVQLGLKMKQQELDLEREYSERLLKVIPAQKLKLLPEVERKFRQMILEQLRRRQMMEDRHPDRKDNLPGRRH